MIYNCKENDNIIEILTEDDKIEEIRFRYGHEKSGGLVIGIDDLNNALKKVGFKISNEKGML